jgi:NDP-sugar pyrophosphorylase family protein
MSPELEGFLLSAGLGTRMGPLSSVLPKPAWPLGGKPLLQWAADDFRREGFTHLGCNTHLHPQRLRSLAVGLEVFDEPLLLGSAGGLSHARGRVKEALLVWNADVLATVPWRHFRHAHSQAHADLSWLLIPHPGGPWRAVWTDDVGRVLPLGESGPRGPYLFTGASCWSPQLLDQLPAEPSEVHAWLPRVGHHLGVVVEPFPWREIGTPQALIEAAAALAPEAEGRVPGCYVHPTASPAGRLQSCVLGPGAAPPAAIEDERAFWFEEEGRQVRLGLT